MNTGKPHSEPLLDGQLDRAIDPQYASISTMAVLGLLFSLAGLAGFFVIPLVALAAIGLVMSLAAARQIRRSAGVLTGRRLAMAGIAVGAVVAAGAASWHTYEWWTIRQVLTALEARSYEVVDDIIAGRYEKVYSEMPEEFRARQAVGPKEFGDRLGPVFKGAGKILGRTVLSLPPPIPMTEGGSLVRAQVRVELDRRLLDVAVIWYQPAGAARWDLVGVGGGETMESMAKYGGEGGPQTISPFQQEHMHEH